VNSGKQHEKNVITINLEHSKYLNIYLSNL